MNSKIKMLLGVLLVLALLSPIYATETPTDVGAISVDDELIEYRPEDDTNTSTDSDLPHVDIEMPGILPDKPDVIVDPIIRPELILNQTEIITKDNYILLTGSLKDLGFTVKYKIRDTTKTGNCRVHPRRPILPIVAERITFTCNLKVSDIEGKYKVDVIAEKTERLNTTTVDLIVDRTAPEVTVDSISTRDRNPILTGTARDNLTDIKALTITINGVNYQPEADEDGTWEVQLDTLPRGTHNVKISAEDEAKNTYIDETENGAIVIRSAGGGTRIVAETPAPTVQANAPAPAPVGPIVVTQPTPVVNTPTTPTTPTTGGTPTTTPTETTPITGNVTAVNPTGTSGATGFLGLPSTSAGTMGMIVGALLVIGAIGYFFFFRK